MTLQFNKTNWCNRQRLHQLRYIWPILH